MSLTWSESLDKELVGMLLSHGMPQELGQTNFKLQPKRDRLRPVLLYGKDKNMAPVTFDYNQQVTWLRTLVEKPLSNQLTVISTLGEDNYAKQFAALMMQIILKYSLKHKIRQTSPRWFNLQRDLDITSNETPAAVFVSNVYPDSTPYRLEQCRDLLQRFNQIPRYVVTSGVNPYEFAVNKLKSTPFAVFNFASKLERDYNLDLG